MLERDLLRVETDAPAVRDGALLMMARDAMLGVNARVELARQAIREGISSAR